ncbi:MAG: putative toxin-antitoxin system toxin component, PIN family [Opitutaceae bacterium]|nr:putative toxin-antitoxin system toxin component, PIN family [Opitutaceae bacterium]
MQTWVLDTNVVVSAFLTSGGTCDRLLTAAFDHRFSLAYDARILREYVGVLSRPHWRFPEGQIGHLENFLRAYGVFVEAPALTLTFDDPDDLSFAEVALATPDRVIVTGNRRHFIPAEKLGVEILSPTAALELLTRASKR